MLFVAGLEVGFQGAQLSEAVLSQAEFSEASPSV
jgi:uncharacterized protein YjbI with pentapeptide repeats